MLARCARLSRLSDSCQSILLTVTRPAGSLEVDLLWDGVSAAEAVHRDDSTFLPSTAAAWRLHAMGPHHEPGGWPGFSLGKVHDQQQQSLG